MKVSVIGAGKMGLPIACRFAQRGATVFACDVNQKLVDAINAGRSPIDEPGVGEIVRETVAAGRLRATTDTASAVAQSDTVVVIVPALLTPDHRADLSILISVSKTVAANLPADSLVIYETTVPVGTTRNVFGPLLAESGRPFLLAFSPERVKSNHVIEKLGITPKVVGGLTAEAGDRAGAFYRDYLGAPVTRVPTPEAAELVKLAGMLYRDVTIALSNQIARYAERAGVDYPSILDATNTDGEAALLQPGIGVGGHCTPVYPYFLIHHAVEQGMHMTLAEEARRINDGQAEHAVARLDEALGGLAGKPVMILGLGFRPGVKEHICSPAFLLRDVLVARGAKVTLADPLYSDDEIRRHGFEPSVFAAAAAAPAAVVLNTAHPEFRTPDFAALRRKGLEAVLDGRNAWNPDEVRAAGLIHLGIGRPATAVV